MATTVFIARHGERIDHVNPSWKLTAKSPHDPYLTDRGLAQAFSLGMFLSSLNGTNGVNVTHIFSSPFYRTVQTAVQVSKALSGNISVCIEPGLGEFLNKDWFPSGAPALRDVSALKQEFECIDTNYEPQVQGRFPECRDDVIVRSGVIARLLADKYTGDIVLIGHGMICEFMARGLTNSPAIPYISYCSLQTCKRRLEKEEKEKKRNMGGLFEVEDQVRIDFMPDSIQPEIKTNWRNGL